MRGRSRATVLFAFAFMLSACGGATQSGSAAPAATATAPPASAAAPSGSAATTKGPLTAAKPEDCLAPSTGEKVKITVWSNTEEQGSALERAMIDEWMKVNPNVEVTYTGGLDLFDSFDKYLASTPAGQGPTIFSAYMPWIPVLQANSLLAPAIPAAMCGTSQQDIVDRYVKGTIDSYVVDGNVVALPVQQNGWSLLINNRKFAENGMSLQNDIPKTWDEMATLKDKLLKKDANGRITQKGFEWRYTGPQWYGNMFTNLMWNLEGEYFDASGAPTFNSDKAVEALRQWKENVTDPKVTSNAQNSPYQDFANEQDVISFGGPNAVSFVESLNPAMKGNITVAHMPKAGPGPNMLYGFPYIVSSKATDAEKAAAWNLLNYLFSDPNRWFKDTGLLQPITGWYEQPSAKDFVGLPVFIEDMTGARALAQTTNYGALQTAIKNAIDRVVLENADPKTSLDQAVQEYKTSIGQ
jgi:ABC-type glycerol-3-phosphate transport system substrate-binding protein